MGKPPITLLISVVVSIVTASGLATSIYGSVVHKPGVSLIGVGITGLAVVYSIMMLRASRSKG